MTHNTTDDEDNPWPFESQQTANIFGLCLRLFEGLVMIASFVSGYLHMKEGGGLKTPVADFHARHALFTFSYMLPRLVRLFSGACDHHSLS
mgnify:CR=1 FL=1|jgi:hypothetical protein